MQTVFLKGFILCLIGVIGFLAYFLIPLIAVLIGPALGNAIGLSGNAGFLGVVALLGIPALALGALAVYRVVTLRPES